MIFRKIGIAAVAAATIFGIAAAFPTAATAQYYGGGHWHGGLGWGLGPGYHSASVHPTPMAMARITATDMDMAPTTATDITITATAARMNSASTLPTRTSP